MTVSAPPSNFAFLQVHDEQLVRLGLLGEQYFAADPNNRPTDYVLFAGSVPLAVVKAKRQFHDVSPNIQQAKRLSRSFNNFGGGEAPGAPCSNDRVAGAFRIPFVFSTIGRPLDHLSRRRTG